MADSNKQKIVHVHLPEKELYTTTLNAGKHQLLADEGPQVKGGRDTGPDPYDYLLMALGSCTVMTLRMYAKHKDWPLDDVYMELRHNKRHAEDCENCEKTSSKLDYIEKEIIVEGELSDEQVNRLLEISQKCPVHRTLLGEIQLESSITHKLSKSG